MKILKNFSDTVEYSKREKSRKLIFIVGMPRSGTSLIEQILSSHKVYGGGELVFMKVIKSKFLLNTNNKIIKTLKFSQEIFEELMMNILQKYLKLITLMKYLLINHR